MSATHENTHQDSHRRSHPGSTRSHGKDKDPRSMSQIISQSLTAENQQGVERVLEEIRVGVESAREYVEENPKEAIALAVAAGAVAWAVLGTKPGRRLLEVSAAVAVPYATQWVADKLADS